MTSEPVPIAAAELEQIFRSEYGHAVAVLARAFGDLDLAEDAVQDAFAIASRTWPATGTPPSPAGWIVTTARNAAIDRLRREASRGERQLEATRLHAPETPVETHVVVDDRLRLIFMCCHPALAQEARIAMTLRLLCGLTTAEIARAFLEKEATIAQRIVRAKSKIRDAGIPFRVPDESDLPTRLHSVLAVLYLIYSEGHSATSGDLLVREDLCAEAIRLARLLTALMPDEPEVMGLLALLLLAESRRAARTDQHGNLVPLAEQDRHRWNQALIAEGQAIVRECLRRDRPGRYQIQAAIQAVHSDSRRIEDTAWRQIVLLYDQLLSFAPNAIVALNRAVAVAEVEGPRAGLTLVDRLDLPDFHLFHAVRADFLRRLGRPKDAVEAYQRAIATCSNSTEREFLARRMCSLDEPCVPRDDRSHET